MGRKARHGADTGEPDPRISRPVGQAILLLIGAGGLAILGFMTWRPIARGADAIGILSGFGLGVALALGFMLVGGGLLAWFAIPHGPVSLLNQRQPTTSALSRELAPLLAEMEAVRAQIREEVRRRLVWMLPLGFAAGVGLAYLTAPHHGRDVNPVDGVTFAFWGVFGGYLLAVAGPNLRYGGRFKERVLPVLAARFGALTYHRPPRPDLARLRRFHVFRHFTWARSDDQIAGEYRGLEVSVLQLELSRLHGLSRRVVFHGLLAEVTLKNRLLGVTAIAADAGALGNLADELASRGVRRAALEDPVFERDYEVYATDQVMARALLTPEFMERFRALDQRFGRPLALAQDDTLMLALPRPGDVFRAPYWRTPAADAETLSELMQDIKAVLAAVDTVIDLDAATREAAKPR